jgi:hypothetical protein
MSASCATDDDVPISPSMSSGQTIRRMPRLLVWVPSAVQSIPRVVTHVYGSSTRKARTRPRRCRCLWNGCVLAMGTKFGTANTSVSCRSQFREAGLPRLISTCRPVWEDISIAFTFSRTSQILAIPSCSLTFTQCPLIQGRKFLLRGSSWTSRSRLTTLTRASMWSRWSSTERGQTKRRSCLSIFAFVYRPASFSSASTLGGCRIGAEGTASTYNPNCLPRISFMISSVPPPIGPRRASRTARSMPYSRI